MCPDSASEPSSFPSSVCNIRKRIRGKRVIKAHPRASPAHCPLGASTASPPGIKDRHACASRGGGGGFRGFRLPGFAKLPGPQEAGLGSYGPCALGPRPQPPRAPVGLRGCWWHPIDSFPEPPCPAPSAESPIAAFPQPRCSAAPPSAPFFRVGSGGGQGHGFLAAAQLWDAGADWAHRADLGNHSGALPARHR